MMFSQSSCKASKLQPNELRMQQQQGGDTTVQGYKQCESSKHTANI